MHDGAATPAVTICVLHPGAMGVSIAADLRRAGHAVRWVEDGRSAATATRAGAAGLVTAGRLGDGLAGADVVVSVCPPAGAIDVAEQVAREGFTGIYVDANAVAPATARRIASIVAAAGATPVDAGIVGPPAERPGTTRIFLSGTAAGDVGALFGGATPTPVVLDADVGAASATKVAYAAWTKGSAALLLAVAGYAEAEGVTGALVAEWARSQPDLPERLAATTGAVVPKAWRFEGELRESARAFFDAGLPDGFGRAAAEIYARLGPLRDGPAPDVDAVRRLLAGGAT
jgi:3-hydroxyisobutyrate dehydrogenase-like beta-hydroxyacid dehydrogenase